MSGKGWHNAVEGGVHDGLRIRCKPCHAAYMRVWRLSHPLTPDQRHKDVARSYANVYRNRGKLVPQSCACGSPHVEMHHPDYSRPLDVEWTCRPCHLQLHKECHT